MIKRFKLHILLFMFLALFLSVTHESLYANPFQNIELEQNLFSKEIHTNETPLEKRTLVSTDDLDFTLFSESTSNQPPIVKAPPGGGPGIGEMPVGDGMCILLFAVLFYGIFLLIKTTYKKQIVTNKTNV